MRTTTISMRLPKVEAGRLDRMARGMGLERPTFFKRALKRGASDLLFEHACQAYRDGEATLSRAAELAGLSLRDLLLKMQAAGLELNYGIPELEKDVRT